MMFELLLEVMERFLNLREMPGRHGKNCFVGAK